MYAYLSNIIITNNLIFNFHLFTLAMFDDIKANTTATFTSANKSRTKDIDQGPIVTKSWTKKLFFTEEADDEEKQLCCINEARQLCCINEEDTMFQRFKETVQANIPHIIRPYKPKLVKEFQLE